MAERDLLSRVQEAREIRRMMIAGELFTFYGCRGFYCPICYRPITDHLYKVPCYRNGEWDRYGLHVAATRLGKDNPFGRGNGKMSIYEVEESGFVHEYENGHYLGSRIASPRDAHIYEVQISGEVADEILERLALEPHLFGKIPFGLPLSFSYGRKSPIKFFIEITDAEAINCVRELDGTGITITRAKKDWSL